MSSTLKLITQYDAGKNEYTVLRHNLTSEDADAALREISAKHFGIFVIDQEETHPDRNPEACFRCRKEIETSSHVQPKPKFKPRR